MGLPRFTAEATLGQSRECHRNYGLILTGGPEILPQRIRVPDFCDTICGGNTACALACRLNRASGLPIVYGDLYF